MPFVNFKFTPCTLLGNGCVSGESCGGGGSNNCGRGESNQCHDPVSQLCLVIYKVVLRGLLNMKHMAMNSPAHI